MSLLWISIPVLILIALVARTIMVLRDPDLKRRSSNMTHREWMLATFVATPLLIVLPVIGGIVAIVLWFIYAPMIASWLFPNGW